MNRRTFLQSSAAFTAASCLAATRHEYSCDVAVIGAGTGGVAAALAAARNGMRVVLTEETDWIGGQLTSQAVPPDEHPWIEEFGCTASYRRYRNAVREYYRQNLPLTDQARSNPQLNPGNGSVSKLTHEPRVSLAVLQAMLAPYVQDGRIRLLLFQKPVSAENYPSDHIHSVILRDVRNGDHTPVRAKYFIDATETGELLPLTKTEFVVGAESHAETGEPHAALQPQPENNQSCTFCFAIDYRPGEDHTIDKPHDYDFWRSYVPELSPPWTGRLLSWQCPDPQTLRPRKLYFDPRPDAPHTPGLNLWTYRRILDPANFTTGSFPSGVSLVNWPQNDYWLGDFLAATPANRERYLRSAKQLSLAWLYWMQTEAPGPGDVAGWKGLRLRKDIVGTEDGLAKAPYIRESRRIRAEFTVLEQHVGLEARRSLLVSGPGVAHADIRAVSFIDSVGIGYYRLDLHPSTGGNNYIDIPSLPFQIPMGALLPVRVHNLLPGCKNLGVTHITNGCYRLHPVEWNIGEAAGAIAAHAIKTRRSPRFIRRSPRRLYDLQKSLVAQGFELHWPHRRLV